MISQIIFEQFLTVLIIAVVLGLDAFSLSMGMGLKGVTKGYELKFAGLVGFFHIIMPLLGLYIGIGAGYLLGIWAKYLGAAVLAYIGIDFFSKGYREIRPRSLKFNNGGAIFSRREGKRESLGGILLLTLSVSVDALTVGFSLGTFQMPVYLTALIIGVMAGVMTLLGFASGRLFSLVTGSYAQLLGGVILITLAIKLLF